MSTNLYISPSVWSQVHQNERTIYSSAVAPAYTYGVNEPIVTDYANWFDDSSGLGAVWPHRQAIGGEWVLVGSVDTSVDPYIYTSVNAGSGGTVIINNPFDIDPLADYTGGWSPNDTMAIENVGGIDLETPVDLYLASVIQGVPQIQTIIRQMTRPYLLMDLGGVAPVGPNPREWVDDSACPNVPMMWDTCENGGAGGYVPINSGSGGGTTATAPVISAVAVNTAFPPSGNGGEYVTGDNLCFDVTFDQPVDVTGVPTLPINLFAPSQLTLTNAQAATTTSSGPANLIVDGDYGTFWVSDGHSQGSTVTNTWVSAELNSLQTISQVAVTSFAVQSRSMRDFDIEVSTDGIYWTPVISRTDYDSSVLGNQVTYSSGAAAYEELFSFPPVTASFVRVYVHRGYQSPTSSSGQIYLGSYTVRIGEVKAFGASSSSSTANATYQAGTGTNTLTFCYPISASDNAVSAATAGPISGTIVSSSDGATSANSTVPSTNFSVTVNQI